MHVARRAGERGLHRVLGVGCGYEYPKADASGTFVESSSYRLLWYAAYAVRTVSRLPVSDRLSAEAPCCADPFEHRELRRLWIGKWMSMLEWDHCDGRPEDSPPRRRKLPRMEPAHGFVEYLGHEQGVRGVCSARQALRCGCMLSACGVLLMHPTYCAGTEACTQIWCLRQDRGSSGFIDSRSSLCQISYTVHKTRVKVREPGHSYRRMRI